MKVKNSGIRLVIYSALNDGDSESVSGAAGRFFPPSQVMRCSSVREVAEALREILSGYGIILIMIRDEAELVRMAGLGDLLKDHAVILIFDNPHLDLSQQALRLYPRYAGSFQDGCGDALTVLEKMIHKIETTIKGGDNG